MKKIIILCIALMLCCSCFHYVEQKQYGVVVDVEYCAPYTSSEMRPILVGKTIMTMPRAVHHSEHWRAHIHYNDTICVYQDFNYEVYPGDSVNRTVIVKI